MELLFVICMMIVLSLLALAVFAKKVVDDYNDDL